MPVRKGSGTGGSGSAGGGGGGGGGPQPPCLPGFPTARYAHYGHHLLSPLSPLLRGAQSPQQGFTMRTGSYSRRAIISERKEVLQLVLGQPACPKTWLQGGALGAASKLHRGLRWAFLRPLLRGLSWMQKRPVCTEFLKGFYLDY